MKSKLLFILLIFGLKVSAQVPNTTTFTLWDVTNTIYGDHSAGRNLSACFTDADAAKFDANYGSKTMNPKTLLGFRNYGYAVAPTVTTTSISSVAIYTATGGGNITSDGNSTVTDRGVCWSTSASPTIYDSHTHDGTGAGVFTSSLTGLSASTIYYVRAYATNSIGTSYGSNVYFTTNSTNLPSINGISSYALQTQIQIGYSYCNSNGCPISVVGVCYSTTNTTPTISDNVQYFNGTSGYGETKWFYGFIHYTTYYMRVFATNANGTTYYPSSGWQVVTQY